MWKFIPPANQLLKFMSSSHWVIWMGHLFHYVRPLFNKNQQQINFVVHVESQMQVCNMFMLHKKTAKHKYILFKMSNPFVLDTYPVSFSACLLIGTTLNSLSGIKIKPSKEWQSNPTFIYISTPHLQKHCSPLYSTSYARAAWLCWDKLCFTEYVRKCF